MDEYSRFVEVKVGQECAEQRNGQSNERDAGRYVRGGAELALVLAIRKVQSEPSDLSLQVE